MTRIPLTSRGNLVLVDLRTRRERIADFARDSIEFLFTVAGTVGFCFLCLAACIAMGWL